MSEPTSTTEPTTDPTATTDPATQGDPAELGEGGKKALEAERAARKAAEKAATEAQARVKEFEDAQKSEAEKAAEALTQAQQAAEAAKVEALRWRIAAKHGISDTDAELFLTGADEESMTAQAERLAARGSDDGNSTNPAPRPDLTQGGSGGGAKSTGDLFAAAIDGAFT